ncbi:tetratricopeptide repeat protein [Paenibacillus chartarius]|uniref:Tetratricopeptide repeat protein n=1 Tax=Paenibacillus chartarius TaxID=747481 RepID=A0ABV6DRV8_9BACL
MSKILLFVFLTYILGNPFVALLVLLVIVYVLDRRFVGLSPSLTRPLRLGRKMKQLHRHLRASPHDTSSKIELARIWIEKKRYAEAERLLTEVLPIMDQSADVHFELGLCKLKLGELEQGRRLMEKALELNPRVRYGEPYLRLAEAVAAADPEEAVRLLGEFRQLHSSSCEAYYRLGRLYEAMGRKEDAKAAYREVGDLYRSLPGYSRKQQRRWALLAWWKRMSV